MWHSEWSALSRRISGLLEAAKFHVSCRVPHTASTDPHQVARRNLLPGTVAIFEHLKEFRRRHAGTLPPTAIAALDSFLENTALFSGSGDNNDIALQFRITALVALETEISYHLTDFSAYAKRISKRAFTHLQRSIVADPECAKRWQDAFTSKGETACEKLGAVHLLWHGIWAFKANSEGERTDLIMGDALRDRLGEIEEVAEALVLTEWKKVTEASELLNARDAAYKQAKLYAGGSLAGVELDAYRYLVLVTREELDLPPDFEEAGVWYHHVNVAVAPRSPSRAARQRRHRSLPPPAV